MGNGQLDPLKSSGIISKFPGFMILMMLSYSSLQYVLLFATEVIGRKEGK